MTGRVTRGPSRAGLPRRFPAHTGGFQSGLLEGVGDGHEGGLYEQAGLTHGQLEAANGFGELRPDVIRLILGERWGFAGGLPLGAGSPDGIDLRSGPLIFRRFENSSHVSAGQAAIELRELGERLRLAGGALRGELPLAEDRLEHGCARPFAFDDLGLEPLDALDPGDLERFEVPTALRRKLRQAGCTVEQAGKALGVRGHGEGFVEPATLGTEPGVLGPAFVGFLNALSKGASRMEPVTMGAWRIVHEAHITPRTDGGNLGVRCWGAFEPSIFIFELHEPLGYATPSL